MACQGSWALCPSRGQQGSRPPRKAQQLRDQILVDLPPSLLSLNHQMPRWGQDVGGQVAADLENVTQQGSQDQRAVPGGPPRSEVLQPPQKAPSARQFWGRRPQSSPTDPASRGPLAPVPGTSVLLGRAAFHKNSCPPTHGPGRQLRAPREQWALGSAGHKSQKGLACIRTIHCCQSVSLQGPREPRPS